MNLPRQLQRLSIPRIVAILVWAAGLILLGRLHYLLNENDEAIRLIRYFVALYFGFFGSLVFKTVYKPGRKDLNHSSLASLAKADSDPYVSKHPRVVAMMAQLTPDELDELRALQKWPPSPPSLATRASTTKR